MPTYEYECKTCGHNFEVFQSIMDAPVKKCPECGKGVRRLIGGGTGIIFKGSGFYVTDSKKSSGSSASSGKQGASSGDSHSESPGSTPSDKGKSGDSSSGKSGEKTTASA